MKRHKFDLISLVLGLLAGGAGLVFFFSGELPDVDGEWILAAGLVILGLMTVFKAIRPSRTGEDQAG